MLLLLLLRATVLLVLVPIQEVTGPNARQAKGHRLSESGSRRRGGRPTIGLRSSSVGGAAACGSSARCACAGRLEDDPCRHPDVASSTEAPCPSRLSFRPPFERKARPPVWCVKSKDRGDQSIHPSIPAFRTGGRRSINPSVGSRLTCQPTPTGTRAALKTNCNAPPGYPWGRETPELWRGLQQQQADGLSTGRGPTPCARSRCEKRDVEPNQPTTRGQKDASKRLLNRKWGGEARCCG